MPAINVAKTDTFEVQRQKINQIGNQIFNISQGGSDLSTGNLKLGDGTVNLPSLGFTSDFSLGLYKSDEKTLGYVSSGSKLVDIGELGIFSYKNFTLQRKFLLDSGIQITNPGTNYDAGSFTQIPLLGGTGSGALASITVVEYTGSIVSGSDYTPGTYNSIFLEGGSGTGAEVSFSIEPVEGDILNSGSGYVSGSYSDVPFTAISGSGSGATANVNIVGTVEIIGSITSPGSGYGEGLYNVELLNEPSQTYVVTVNTNPGSPPPDNVYFIDGNQQQVLNLVKGNTYRFNLTDVSLTGHPFGIQTLDGLLLNENFYKVVSKSIQGNGIAAYLDIIISPDAPTESLRYYCSVHENMGAVINIVEGTSGNYGSGLQADIQINSTGNVSSVTVTDSGINYKIGDTLELFPLDASTGSGNGFLYTISNVVYNGEITSVTVTSSGSGYATGDILSFNNTDLNGFGSGFQYSISSNPGKISEVTFGSRGTNYQLNDVLSLPQEVTNISSILKGTVTGVTATLSTASNSITVSSTAGIISGMTVSGEFTDTGTLAEGTTVLSVDSQTILTLSQAPTQDGAANLTFSSPGDISQISLTSVEGINFGYEVNKISGNGVLAENTTVTGVDTINNIITLSTAPVLAGDVVLDFIPPYGIPSENFTFTITNIGEIESITIEDGGNGYSVSDVLTVNSSDLSNPITYTVTNKNLQTLTFVNTYPVGTFSIGDQLKKKDGLLVSVSISNPGDPLTPTVITQSATLDSGTPVVTVSSTAGITPGMIVTIGLGSTGQVSFGTTVFSVDSATQLTLSQNPTVSGSATLDFTSDETATYTNISFTTNGSGIGGSLDVNRGSDGSISNVSINDPGYNHSVGDILVINGSNIGGSSPANNLEITIESITTELETTIYDISVSNGNIDSVVVEERAFSDGDILFTFPIPASPTAIEINTASTAFYKFFINNEYNPSIVLYSNNTYIFNYSDSSNSDHIFALSKFKDGFKSPSIVENISSLLSTSSNTISVSDSTGILEGMLVSVISGSGVLETETLVSEVNGNIITLNKSPVVNGPVNLTFTGVEYTVGVERVSDTLRIRIFDDTPNLYYFCASLSSGHDNEGGQDNQENLLTVDLNNPKIFGSGLQFLVNNLNSTNVIENNIETGLLTAVDFSGDSISVTTANVSDSITSLNLSSNSITCSTLTASDSNITVNSPTTFSGNLKVGSNVNITSASGNIETVGNIITSNSVILNNILTLKDNTISTASSNNLVLSPATGRVVKVNSTSALTIPAGTTAQRPTTNIVENGSIRFNTQTNQYEGYSAVNLSWSSLGGIRDLDGNTTILAEETVGANDNTLWFINDNINTVRFTPQYQEFVNVKKIRSVNTSAPDYVTWTANTPVNAGDYLKYRNNIYEVITGGTTATSGSEPTNTSGDPFPNGTATLQFATTAVAQLTFEEISQLNIDPLGFTDLVVNGELRFSNNVISTDVNDLVIQPNSGQKVSINSNTSLVIPVGDSNSRGNAAQGSIRFNTAISQYEGYDGTNWSSLGGVRDVDGNTYIIPETSAGANENILYFYNNNSNTLRVTESQVEFDSIDTIASGTSDALNINAATVTFDSLATTLDNTSATETFLFGTKENFDIGLSAGLVVDPILRLNDTGEIYYNLGFGTGFYDGVRLLDPDLKEFELSDYKLVTRKVSLQRGLINSGSTVIYDPAIHAGAKVEIVAHNTTTGDKEFIEYSVVDKGSDIFHTEFGNIKTGAELISTSFDFNANSNVRVTFTLSSLLSTGNNVQVTIVSNIIKR